MHLPEPECCLGERAGHMLLRVGPRVKDPDRAAVEGDGQGGGAAHPGEAGAVVTGLAHLHQPPLPGRHVPHHHAAVAAHPVEAQRQLAVLGGMPGEGGAVARLLGRELGAAPERGGGIGRPEGDEVDATSGLTRRQQDARPVTQGHALDVVRLHEGSLQNGPSVAP
jgi:hypothetical protein